MKQPRHTLVEARSCPGCSAPITSVVDDPRAAFCSQCRFPLLLVAGKYRIEGLLARGGFGTVYLATHVRLTADSERVVKVLPPAVMNGPEARRRFEREVQVTASLSQRNPHIVRIYDDFGEIDGLGAYYVMEYLRGRSLRALLVEHGRLAPSRALELFEQLCSAMGAAHREGIIHRDLKPENLLLVPDRGLTVIDFGIARVPHAASSVITSGIIGTPGYMAPELCRGEAADARSDVYAMGLILYEMLTGQAPLPRDLARASAGDLMRAHLFEPPVPIDERCPGLGLPRALEAVILDALRKEPDERPNDAQALAQVVRRAGLEVAPASPRVPEAGRDVTSRTPFESAETVEAPSSLASRRERRGLPVPPTPFVGRRAELVHVHQAIEQETRLITLFGPGGAGKTRLAIQAAHQHVGRHPDAGVWMAELTEARSASDVVAGVERALAIGPTDGPVRGDGRARVGHALAGRGRALLVLDNAEQVVEPVADCLAFWLKAAPETTFLVTSRERLRLGEELCIETPPLTDDDGIALFVSRARAAEPRFETGASTGLIGELVRRLDGNPLAIELAAARARIFSPAQLLARLQDRFRLLRSSSRSAGKRHGTLRAAIDWSWELLPRAEQQTLAQASVFRGGFDLEAAEAVVQVTGEGATDAPVFDLIEALLDKSLLRTWRPSELPGRPRFGLFESIREYAADKLRASGDVDDCNQRHSRHFDRLGASLALRDGATARPNELERLALEADNLWSAFNHCRQANPERAVRIALALDPVLLTRGPAESHLALLDSAVESCGNLARDDLLMACLTARGQARLMRGDLEGSGADLSAALELASAQGAEHAIGTALTSLSQWHAQQGRLDQAESLALRACELHRAGGRRHLEGVAEEQLGRIYRVQARHDEAAERLAKARAALAEAGDRRREGKAVELSAVVHYQQGRLEEARRLYDQAIGIAREVGDRANEASALTNLALIHMEQDRLELAERLYEQALAYNRGVGNRRDEGIALTNLGLVAHELGRLDEAAERYGDALAVHRELHNLTSQGIVLGNLAALHLEAGRLDEAERACQSALALHREVGNARAEAVFLGTLGHIRRAQGRGDEAETCHREALATHSRLHNPRYEGISHGALAVLAAEKERLDEVGAHLAAARLALESVGDGSHLIMIDVLEGHLDLALARQAQAAGDDAAKRRHAEAAQRRWTEAGSRAGEAVGPVRSAQLRMARDELRRALERLST